MQSKVCETIVILVKSEQTSSAVKPLYDFLGKSFCFTIPYANLLFYYRFAFHFFDFFSMQCNAILSNHQLVDEEIDKIR